PSLSVPPRTAVLGLFGPGRAERQGGRTLDHIDPAGRQGGELDAHQHQPVAAPQIDDRIGSHLGQAIERAALDADLVPGLSGEVDNPIRPRADEEVENVSAQTAAHRVRTAVAADEVVSSLAVDEV